MHLAFFCSGRLPVGLTIRRYAIIDVHRSFCIKIGGPTCILTLIFLQGYAPPPCGRQSCSSSSCASLSRWPQTRTRRSWLIGRSGRARTESPMMIWWDTSDLRRECWVHVHACAPADPNGQWCVCICCAGGLAEEGHLGGEQAADWRQQSGVFNGLQAFYYGHE